MAVPGHPSASRIRRGLPSPPFRGHEPVRHPRQACHHHAERHPAREADTWCMGRSWVDLIGLVGTDEKNMGVVRVGMHLAGNLVEFGKGKPWCQGANGVLVGIFRPHARGHLGSVMWYTSGRRGLVLGACQGRAPFCSCWPFFFPWSMVVVVYKVEVWGR